MSIPIVRYERSLRMPEGYLTCRYCRQDLQADELYNARRCWEERTIYQTNRFSLFSCSWCKKVGTTEQRARRQHALLDELAGIANPRSGVASGSQGRGHP